MTQLRRMHGEHLTRLRDARRDEHPQAGQQVELTEEPARPVTRDDLFVVSDASHDLHLAAEHDKEVVGRVALPVQEIARFNPSARAECLERRDLRRVEHRKCDQVVSHGRNATGSLPRRVDG